MHASAGCTPASAGTALPKAGRSALRIRRSAANAGCRRGLRRRAWPVSRSFPGAEANAAGRAAASQPVSGAGRSAIGDASGVPIAGSDGWFVTSRSPASRRPARPTAPGGRLLLPCSGAEIDTLVPLAASGRGARLRDTKQQARCSPAGWTPKLAPARSSQHSLAAHERVAPVTPAAMWRERTMQTESGQNEFLLLSRGGRVSRTGRDRPRSKFASYRQPDMSTVPAPRPWRTPLRAVLAAAPRTA